MTSPIGGSGYQQPLVPGQVGTVAQKGATTQITGKETLSILSFSEKATDPILEFFKEALNTIYRDILAASFFGAASSFAKLPTQAEIEAAYQEYQAEYASLNGTIDDYNQLVSDLTNYIGTMNTNYSQVQTEDGELDGSNFTNGMDADLESALTTIENFRTGYPTVTEAEMQQALATLFSSSESDFTTLVAGNLNDASGFAALYHQAFTLYNQLVNNPPVTQSDWDALQAQINAFNAEVTDAGSLYPTLGDLPPLVLPSPTLTGFGQDAQTLITTPNYFTNIADYLPDPESYTFTKEIEVEVPDGQGGTTTEIQTVVDEDALDAFIAQISTNYTDMKTNFSEATAQTTAFINDAFQHISEFSSLTPLTNLVPLTLEDYQSQILLGWLSAITGEAIASLEGFEKFAEEAEEEAVGENLANYRELKGKILIYAFSSIGGAVAVGVGGDLPIDDLAQKFQEALIKDMQNTLAYPELSSAFTAITAEIGSVLAGSTGVAAILAAVNAKDITQELSLTSPELLQALSVLTTLENFETLSKQQLEKNIEEILSRVEDFDALTVEEQLILRQVTSALLQEIQYTETLALALLADFGRETDLLVSAFTAKLAQDLFDANLRALEAADERRAVVEERARFEENLLRAYSEDLTYNFYLELSRSRELREPVEAINRAFEAARVELFTRGVEITPEQVEQVATNFVSLLEEITLPEQTQLVQTPALDPVDRSPLLSVAVLQDLLGKATKPVLPNTQGIPLGNVFLVKFNQNEAEYRIENTNAFQRNREEGETFKEEFAERLQNTIFGDSYKEFVQHLATSKLFGEEQKEEQYIRLALEIRDAVVFFGSNAELAKKPFPLAQVLHEMQTGIKHAPTEKATGIEQRPGFFIG